MWGQNSWLVHLQLLSYQTGKVHRMLDHLVVSLFPFARATEKIPVWGCSFSPGAGGEGNDNNEQMQLAQDRHSVGVALNYGAFFVSLLLEHNIALPDWYTFWAFASTLSWPKSSA